MKILSIIMMLFILVSYSSSENYDNYKMQYTKEYFDESASKSKDFLFVKSDSQDQVKISKEDNELKLLALINCAKMFADGGFPCEKWFINFDSSHKVCIGYQNLKRFEKEVKSNKALECVCDMQYDRKTDSVKDLDNKIAIVYFVGDVKYNSQKDYAFVPVGWYGNGKAGLFTVLEFKKENNLWIFEEDKPILKRSY